MVINYSGGLPVSVTFTVSGLTPNATIYLLVNGVQRASATLPSSGSGSKTYSFTSAEQTIVNKFYPNPAGLASILISSANYNVDNQTGTILEFSASDGTNTAKMELTY